MAETLEGHLGREQRDLLAGLSSPAKIQAFLDATPYSTQDFDRCPLRVLRDRRAHCFDGALFAAMALRRLGYPPLVIDMLPDPGMDDDHVLAVYRRHGRYGAVAKSNFAGLRYREPVYATLRELVMSYFEDFFNVDGVRTLRTYTRPLNLAALDRFGWESRDSGAEAVEKRLASLKPIPLISPEMAAELSLLDELSYKAGTLGANPEGLYRPSAPGHM